MTRLKLFVLGQPRLERDGQPVELNLRKALALLADLAGAASRTAATHWRPYCGPRAASARPALACAARSIA
jgi:hypothetical protein